MAGRENRRMNDKPTQYQTTEQYRAKRDALAKQLCAASGHNPDAVGHPPNNIGAATPDHAFPRWMLWRREADKKLKETP